MQFVDKFVSFLYHIVNMSSNTWTFLFGIIIAACVLCVRFYDNGTSFKNFPFCSNFFRKNFVIDRTNKDNKNTNTLTNSGQFHIPLLGLRASDQEHIFNANVSAHDSKLFGLFILLNPV